MRPAVDSMGSFVVQDERSLEDKILRYNPMREDASDEEQAKSDGEESDTRYKVVFRGARRDCACLSGSPRGRVLAYALR